MVPESFFTQMLGITLAGRYELLKVLGSGGFGGVFAGRDRVLDRPIAVKILTPTLTGESYFLRFHREAQLLARLHHPNIVQVIDFGQHEKLAFLVMELVDGESLTRVIEQGLPIPPLRLVALCDQILQALAEAHANGIVHRDLKPDNILVVQRRDLSELVKMVDFGTATLLEPGDVFRTTDGHFYGTPAYMSPEQCRDMPLDARSDLYSFGCMLYQMLCGSPPFLAPGPLETLMAHVLQDPVAPSLRVKSGLVPPGLEHLALWCLQKHPDARPESAEALRLELHRIARDGFVPPRLPPVVPLKGAPRNPGLSPVLNPAQNPAQNPALAGQNAGQTPGQPGGQLGGPSGSGYGGASKGMGAGLGASVSSRVEPTGVRVVLATDASHNHRGLIEALECLQMDLSVVRSGELERIVGGGGQGGEREGADKRSLVLLDGADPALDGWCKSLLRMQIPFSICGDESDIAGMARAVELGAMDYIPLPVSPEGLRRSLARMARPRRPGS